MKTTDRMVPLETRNSRRARRIPAAAALVIAAAFLLALPAALLLRAGEEDTPPAQGKDAAAVPAEVLAAPKEPKDEAASPQDEGPIPEDDECLACHGSKTLKADRDGKTISLHVDKGILSASVHSKAACVDCHADLRGKDLPHPKGGLQKAACGGCHAHRKQAEEHAASLHGQALAKGDVLAPRCQDCHGGHEIAPERDPRSPVNPMNIPLLCGKCHREGAPVQLQRDIPQHNILENYSESIHGEGLLKKGLIVSATCASCHTAHRILPHTDEASSIARKNIARTCTQCHAQIEQVHRKIIRGELWEKEAHVLPACVDCHQPHKARKVFYDQGMSDRDCLLCHGRDDLRSSDGRLLSVNAGELAGSRHSKTACSQCHSGADPSKGRPCETILSKVDCSACHDERAQEFTKSIHGQLLAKNDPNAPTCLICHGTHGVRGKADPASPTYPTKVPDLCGRCHLTGQKAALRYTGKEQEIISRYSESIHGKGLLQSGLIVTAMCTSCHTSHGILPQSDPASSVNSANLPVTCGHCHSGIEEQFDRSVHSPLVTKTTKELPVCSNCHTAHSITRTDRAGFRLEILQTCGRCHPKVTESYFDTQHGKVSQLGSEKSEITAKCFDCHGAHDILPVTDPRSRLSRQNVVGTCQKCHPGATRRFAGYLTHATHHDPEKYPLLFLTFWGMTSLLLGTFLVAGIHTLLWLPRAFQMRKALATVQHHPGEKMFVRFSNLNRALHVTMIVSFISLALTGMILKFSYTGWARLISKILGGFQSAGYIHRLAAVIMIALFLIHVVNLFQRKRREFGSWRVLLFGPHTLIPTWKDLKEIVGSLKWFLGLGERPRYGRWTYWEKFDYFAVFWGIAIIGSTGLLLWFSEFFTQFIPGWALNVAIIVHSDEALLAVGFIFTIHFFNTHLRPEKFPMDLVVFTGQMPIDELKRDRPLEYEELARKGELEKHLREPYQPIVIRTIRIFAWTALAIGFGLVLLIIYAMIFAYR